jgi:thymidylate kinase
LTFSTTTVNNQMRIAITGSTSVGKSTLIKQFLQEWPMYKQPAKTYRDIIKDQNIQLSKQGNKESQRAILNALVDEVQLASVSDDRHIIFDRCTVDNIAYSLWHYAKETPGFTNEYIIDSKAIAALALKHVDVIFYLPIRQEIPITPRDGRETDPVFREEIDNILDALVDSYEKNTGAFFPTEDCPAVIRLEGPPDMRIPQMKLYIKENGNGYGEEDGSLIDASKVVLDGEQAPF